MLVGLPSTGLHTNGYSLARKVLFEVLGCRPEQVLPEGLGARIKVGAWEIPPVFRLLAERGEVPEDLASRLATAST